MRKSKILITGCNGGIGKALCQKFKKQNWYVVGIDHQKKSVIKIDEYVDINFLEIENKKNEKKLKDLSNSTFADGLDCLINNASVQIVKSFKNLNKVDFYNSLKINTFSPFVLIRCFIDNLILMKGSIINIGSIHSVLTKKNFLAYSTSKAALEAMTRGLAIEFASKLRVNTISPAAINTKMLVDGFIDKKKIIARLGQYHPSGKIGDPSTVAEVAFFLATFKDQFLNGSIIDLSGGISSRLYDNE